MRTDDTARRRPLVKRATIRPATDDCSRSSGAALIVRSAQSAVATKATAIKCRVRFIVRQIVFVRTGRNTRVPVRNTLCAELRFISANLHPQAPKAFSSAEFIGPPANAPQETAPPEEQKKEAVPTSN
jgi:hypothetical protein